MAKELIGINEVGLIFGKTVGQMRNYKNFGIIEPKTKNGAKELYLKEEILFCKKLLDENLTKMSLKQIGELIQRVLKERRK